MNKLEKLRSETRATLFRAMIESACLPEKGDKEPKNSKRLPQPDRTAVEADGLPAHTKGRDARE